MDASLPARRGSVYLEVEVPAFYTAAMMLGTIAIGYADGARVPVAPTLTAGSGRAAPQASAPKSALPFAISLDRVFSASDTLRAYVEATAPVTGLTASLDVVNDAGKVVASHSPSFTSGNPVRIGSDVPLLGLPRGVYLLRVTLVGGGQKAIRETGFAVR